MSRAAVSVFAFSVYLFALGSILIVIPNALLSIFRIAETTEVWIRVVGVLVLVLGFYFFTAARSELTAFFRATVYSRYAVLAFFVAFVILGFAPPVLVVFGVIDAGAATWTGLALRSQSRA